MRLLVLAEKHWKVIAPIREQDGEDFCDLQDELEALRDSYDETVTGLYLIWERIPNVGPRALGTAIYHEAIDGTGIYEFVKGRLRVYCFEAAGALVVCSHAIVKKGQQTAKGDKKRALKLQGQYRTAAAKGEVRLIATRE